MSTFNHEIHNEHSVNYPITHKIHNEHSANYLHRPRNTQRTFRKLSTSPTKYTANTPLGVGADSSRPYLPSINSVSVCHHFMGVYIYAGTINRPLQLLTDCDNACEHSANYLRSPTKYTTNTPLNAENRFIVPVYFCCHFIYCSKPNRRNQKQATLKITNKDRRIIPTHCLQEKSSTKLRT